MFSIFVIGFDLTTYPNSWQDRRFPYLSNIAEGACRESAPQFINFLYYSNGSVAELSTQLTLLKRIGKYSDIDCDHLLDECNQIAKMLYGLIESVKRKK